MRFFHLSVKSKSDKINRKEYKGVSPKIDWLKLTFRINVSDLI